MTKSMSRKKIESRLRQGKSDPRIQRGSWHGVRPVTRVKPNKRKENTYDEKEPYLGTN